jgi:hypothetical protein
MPGSSGREHGPVLSTSVVTGYESHSGGFSAGSPRRPVSRGARTLDLRQLRDVTNAPVLADRHTRPTAVAAVEADGRAAVRGQARSQLTMPAARRAAADTGLSADAQAISQ